MKCLEWLKFVYLIQKSPHSSTLPAALIQEAHLWWPPLLFHPISMPFQFFTDAGTWLPLRRCTWGGLALHGKVSGPTFGCEKNKRIERWIILACFLHYRNDGISGFMMSGKRRFLVSFFTWDYLPFPRKSPHNLWREDAFMVFCVPCSFGQYQWLKLNADFIHQHYRGGKSVTQSSCSPLASLKIKLTKSN